MSVRRQLTLFVPAPARDPIEAWRRVLDPVQAGLIAAHVTLCREDEIASQTPEVLCRRLAAWTPGPLAMAFGPAERFEGHGVLLRCAEGADAFQRLRQHVLADPAARWHGAHLTLAHPRHPRAEGNTDEALNNLPSRLSLAFPRVALIEQHGSDPWQWLWEQPLGVPVSP